MDRELLVKFENYIENNEPYYHKFITNSGKRILVLKYPFTNFQIQLVDKNKDLVLEFYQSLGPFDCFNMIEELMVN